MRAPFRSVAMRLGPAILLVALSCAVLAQQGISIPSVKLGIEGSKGQGEVSSSLQILALLTVLSIAPAIMILMTAFTRIVIIFGFLRNALGAQGIPPNQVLVGLSLFLTFFVMAPTYGRINEAAIKPLMSKKISIDQAIAAAQKPVREFMLKNTYEKDLLLFVNMRGEKNQTRENISLITLAPAFIISELKTAFIVGFYIFIPFLIIELIVASGLMSMGMMMLPPVVVSLPAKLLVFILADGWSSVVGAIMQGYR